MADVKCVLIHDNFQNFKGYCIPKAQLVIADIPYTEQLKEDFLELCRNAKEADDG